jgi:hypothetical protein
MASLNSLSFSGIELFYQKNGILARATQLILQGTGPLKILEPYTEVL